MHCASANQHDAVTLNVGIVTFQAPATSEGAASITGSVLLSD